MRIVVLGPPGAGKGTQAEMLERELGLKHLSTGDILREEVRKGTELGKRAEKYMKSGELVPDDLIVEMMEKEISKYDNFVLDGFPRNLKQAEALDKMCRIDKVILLEVPDEVILERLSLRRSCPKCNRVYHLKYNPPKENEICDYCGAKLYQRDDDKEEVIKKRLEVYRKETEPIAKFYREKGILVKVNGSKSIEEIFSDIKGVLGNGD
ncbi:adenylate kinase [Thermococci archaeon]|nr:MAG: adenylate kinase [Thermococci archaeon]